MKEGSLTYEKLGEAALREAAEQTFAQWGGRRSPEAHLQRILDCLERFGPRMRYVGLRNKDRALVASAKLYDIVLKIQNREASTIGIGAVFVPESQRKRGYGQALVKTILQEARRSKTEAALLYSDIAPSYYIKLGFRELPALDWSAASARLPDEAPLQLRAAETSDRESIMAWYHHTGRGVDVYPARSGDLWETLRWFRSPLEDLVLLDGGKPVGYLSVNSDSEGLHILEWAAPGIPRPRVWAVIRGLALQRGKEQVFGWLRPDYKEEWMNIVRRGGALPMVAFLGAEPSVSWSFFSPIDHF